MSWSEEQIMRILTNPFYCLRNIDERLTGEHEPLISEEDFVKGGAKLIREHGPEEYLRQLLENLKGNFVVKDDISGEGNAFGYNRK
jgi:hypothetical protein